MINTEDRINPLLIHPRPTNGCPTNTIDGVTTCYCEDHCSWSRCRLEVPPEECLENTLSTWKWNHMKNQWTAQGIVLVIIIIRTF